MEDIKLGDLTVKDNGSLGCDFYLGEDRIMWLNTHSEDELITWLSKKPDPSHDLEIDRVSSGRIRPLARRKKDTTDNRKLSDMETTRGAQSTYIGKIQQIFNEECSCDSDGAELCPSCEIWKRIVIEGKAGAASGGEGGRPGDVAMRLGVLKKDALFRKDAVAASGGEGEKPFGEIPFCDKCGRKASMEMSTGKFSFLCECDSLEGDAGAASGGDLLEGGALDYRNWNSSPKPLLGKNRGAEFTVGGYIPDDLRTPEGDAGGELEKPDLEGDAGNDDLKPCPVCFESNLEIQMKDGEYRVICKICKYKSVFLKNKETIINIWNGVSISSVALRTGEKEE